jgi:F0F1-type ATP synthase assembly protein I
VTEPEKPGESPRDLPGLAAFLAMGSTIATTEAVGVVAGLLLDRWWGIAPVGLVAGIVLGTAAAVVGVVRQIRRYL